MAITVGTNSFLSVADATAILADRFDSQDWVSAGPVKQAKALVSATREIDETSWIGQAVSASQSLGWPRKRASFVDPKLRLTVTIAEDEIPDRVKIATAELALYYIQNPTAIDTASSTAEEITVGPISISDANTQKKVSRMAPGVSKLLNPLILRSATSNAWWRAN